MAKALMGLGPVHGPEEPRIHGHEAPGLQDTEVPRLPGFKAMRCQGNEVSRQQVKTMRLQDKATILHRAPHMGIGVRGIYNGTIREK